MATLRRNFGATGGRAVWQNGDFDYGGRVGPRDLLLLRGNLGDRMPDVPPARFAAVPEPGALAVLIPLAAFTLRRRSVRSPAARIAATPGASPESARATAAALAATLDIANGTKKPIARQMCPPDHATFRLDGYS